MEACTHLRGAIVDMVLEVNCFPIIVWQKKSRPWTCRNSSRRWIIEIFTGIDTTC